MRKNNQSVFLLILGFCWLARLTMAATAAPLYSVTDLGTVGGSESGAIGINNSGSVVGWSATSGDAAGHATLWNGGAPTDLGTLGGAYSYAGGNNNNGLIVGWSTTAAEDVHHATLWESGVLVDLNNVLDASGSGWALDTAVGINDLGQIIGVGYNSAGQEHAFLLTPDTDPVAVPVPPTLALFASGLGGLGFLQWRRKRNQRTRIIAR